MTFMHYMQTFHPKVYLYPIARACGGSRQDVGTEGAIPALMNTPYYLGFLNWRLNTGADGILEKKLSTLLGSTEVQGLLRILSIIHISVVLPTRWLGGKTQVRKMTYSSSSC